MNSCLVVFPAPHSQIESGEALSHIHPNTIPPIHIANTSEVLAQEMSGGNASLQRQQQESHHVLKLAEAKAAAGDVNKLFKQLITLVENQSHRSREEATEDEGSTSGTSDTDGISDLTQAMANLSLSERVIGNNSLPLTFSIKHKSNSGPLADHRPPRKGKAPFPMSVLDIHSLVKETVAAAIREQMANFQPYPPPGPTGPRVYTPTTGIYPYTHFVENSMGRNSRQLGGYSSYRGGGITVKGRFKCVVQTKLELSCGDDGYEADIDDPDD
jgi:hypothetical protein